MFKITYPAVVVIHACRSAGRGRGRLLGFPCMGDGALQNDLDISYPMPPLRNYKFRRGMPYILFRSYPSR